MAVLGKPEESTVPLPSFIRSRGSFWQMFTNTLPWDSFLPNSQLAASALHDFFFPFKRPKASFSIQLKMIIIDVNYAKPFVAFPILVHSKPWI